MMIMILVVHGELMDVIEMMLDRQADLVVHLDVFSYPPTLIPD